MKEHFSQGRGILAAMLLAVFAAFNLGAADARFIVVVKGQRWMQTNSASAVPVPGTNHSFLVSVDLSGPETITNGSLILPDASVLPLEGDGSDHGGLEAFFTSQGALDTDFPNGTYKVVIDGVNDGAKTNAVTITGDSYPSTPRFNAFPAAQAVDPAVDFNLTWDPIAGASPGDFVGIEVADCLDEEVAHSPQPGEPNALNGTATNFVIRARSLRPGMMYKVKLFVGHFTTYDSSSYPGAIVAGGYLKELFMPIQTTGVPVDCPPGRLQLVFNFPPGGFDQTNGVITFPQALASYAVQLDVPHEANAPENVAFSGPPGSGLTNTPSAFGGPYEGGAWFVSPQVPLPPYPPAGVYVVHYGPNNWSYNLLDPGAASQQMLMVPSVVLNEANEVIEVTWRYADTNGVTIDAPTYVENISLVLDSMFGPLYQSDWYGEPLGRTTTAHVLGQPVPWESVSAVSLIYRDLAKNTFASSFHRGSVPPPEIEIVTQTLPGGIVGQTYGASLSVNGGQEPYVWTVSAGTLPEGLNLSPDTGNIIGHPAVAGTTEFVIRVTDSTDAFAERSYFISVRGSGGPTGPEVREIVILKGQEFVQTGDAAPVPNPEDPFHFEAFVEGTYYGSITNAVLRSPKGTNHPLELEDMPSSAPAAGGGEIETENEGQTFRLRERFASRSAMDNVFGSGSYSFTLATGAGSNKVANLNLSGDSYPATPQISNWAAAQSIDAYADFTLTWNSLSGATTNDFVWVQIEDELGTVYESAGPAEPDRLHGKSTSALIPGGTLEPGSQYQCTVFLAKFSTVSTNAFPGARAMSAYARATSILLNTVTPPPVEGQFQFSASSFTASETNTTAQFTILRTGGSEGAVSVDFSTADGTAVADLDYVPTEGTLEFADGETNVTFTFEIIDDQIFETNETVRLVLSNPQGGATIGAGSNAVMILTDNDVPGSAGLLQFSAASYVAGEGSATVTLTVTRTGGKAGEVTVDYLTVDGDALGEADFAPDSGTLVFPDGVTSRTIVIGLNDDDFDETNETFEVMLDAPVGGASLGTRNVATVVITDNDAAGEIRFSAPSIKIDETAGEAEVTLTRSGGTAEGVTVDVTVVGGTASAEDDYSLMTETVEFAAGETTATFSLLVNDDSDSEGDETVLLQLANPTGGATLGKGTNATVTIVDDEVSLQLAAASYTVNEGSPTLVVTVTRSGPTTGTSTVELSTVDGSAEADSDFGGTNVTVTFGPGQTSRTVPIRIVRDDLVEEEETFGLQLDNPVGGQLGNVTEAEVTLIDDDVGGVISFKVAGYTVKESARAAVVLVTRTGGDAAGVMFDFTTEDGSAGDGDDYTGVTETVEFGAGASSVRIEVPILNDAFDETNETVLLSISNPGGGATIGELDAAMLTIIDDDTAGVIAFGAAAYSVSETGVTATVTLTRSGGKAAGVAVDVLNLGGTATADEDYTDFHGTTVTFDENETKVTFSIDILDDSDADGNETVLLALDNPAGGARLGSRTNAVLNIQDDERSLQFSVSATNVVEGVRNLVLTVTRSGPLKGAITVQYATADDSATAGSDYTAKTGTLTFGSNAKSKTITIPILNDTSDEADEEFTVTLSNPTPGVSLGENSSVTVTIQDNDPASRSVRAGRR